MYCLVIPVDPPQRYVRLHNVLSCDTGWSTIQTHPATQCIAAHLGMSFHSIFYPYYINLYRHVLALNVFSCDNDTLRHVLVSPCDTDTLRHAVRLILQWDINSPTPLHVPMLCLGWFYDSMHNCHSNP